MTESPKPITPAEFKGMSASERREAAQRNMADAIKFLGWEEEEVIEKFDLDERKLNQRILKENWTNSEIEEVLSELKGAKKRLLYTENGFAGAVRQSGDSWP